MMRTMALVVLALGGCAVPGYAPEVVAVPSMPSAFGQVEGVFRSRYPRIAVRDETEFRLQSAWMPLAKPDPAGRCRASLFRTDPLHIGIVVEVQWLRLGLDGAPYWTSPVGSLDLERELAAAVSALFGPGRP